jgi:glucose/arabinose dehydrogenase
MWLSILVPAGKADVLGQTVPTMPAPTHTASPTRSVTPSATSPALPSATSPRVTAEMPTQTEVGAVPSATPTSTSVATATPPEGILATASPGPTVGSITETVEGNGVVETSTQVVEETNGGIGNTGLLVGLIIGGIVLVMVVVAVMVVLSGGRKR